jgi:hypothetical protein
MFKSAVAMLDISVQHPPIHNLISIYETDDLKMNTALHEGHNTKC